MACKHPMKDREMKGGKLICNACGIVLRDSNPQPTTTDDLFAAGPATEEHPAQACSSIEICLRAKDYCTEEGRIERDSVCFEAADVPGDDTPAETNPFDGEEADPASIPAAPETVSASSEGLTIGNRSEAFKAPVSVQVTPIQLGEYSLEQATLYRELKETEQAKKDTAKAYADRITRIETRLDELSKIVTEGVIEVPIDCQWEFHYEMGFKRLVRLDTHAVVDEKTLTTEEYQQDLGFQADQSVAAVEECFKGEENIDAVEELEKSFSTIGNADDLLPGQCPECRFKNGNHSPVCSRRPADTYSLCECNVCGVEVACIPYDRCKECADGVMQPADVGPYETEEST